MSEENQTFSPVKIFKNFGFLSVGKTLGDVFTFVMFVALSRAYGQEGLGQYSFAMAMSGFFVVFADFGLYYFSVKEMSRQGDELKAFYGKIFALRLVLSTLVMAVVLLALPWIPFAQEQKIIIALIGAYQVLYTVVDGFSAMFVAREDMHLAGLLELSLRMFASLAALAVIFTGGSLIAAISVLPLVTFLQIGVAFAWVARKYGAPWPAFSLDLFRNTLRESIPYALFRLLYQLSTRVDVLLLGILIGASAAGIYNAAYRVIFILMYLAYFASMSLFPTASKLYKSSREELNTFYHRSLRMIVLVSLPLAAGIWLIAPGLVNLIYGQEFAESAEILRYLSLLILIAFLQNVLGTFLTASDRQVERTRGQWYAALVNGAGNLILIMLLGIRGAAIATLFSETLLVLIFVVRLKALFGWPRLGSRPFIGATASAAFCLFFLYFSSIPMFLVIPLSAVIYVGVLYAFKDFREHEGRGIVRALVGVFGKYVKI
jgi:O-antigen/teichoic acid export membrane protein